MANLSTIRKQPQTREYMDDCDAVNSGDDADVETSGTDGEKESESGEVGVDRKESR